MNPAETGLYYLQSRYYDPETGRFINADVYISTGQGIVGNNMYAYCGNNPVNRTDSTGTECWHWAIGAGIVAACAIATVVTCGGFAAAVTAVALVGNGVAATTAASTIAAGAFIGSATAYGVAVLAADATSTSIQDFNDQGNWGTVAVTAGGAVLGGYSGYSMSQTQQPTGSTNGSHTSGMGNPDKNANPGGSYTKLDKDGNLYSYTQFDELGRQTLRLDYQGRSHAGVLPHFHLYTYPEQGGRREYIFDMGWRQIK